MKISEKDSHLIPEFGEATIIQAQGLVYTSAHDCRVNLNYEKTPQVLRCALAMLEGREEQKTKRTHIERALNRVTKAQEKTANQDGAK